MVCEPFPRIEDSKISPMAMTRGDELVPRALAGDMVALEQLLRHHRSAVFRYGRRVCQTTEDAEDAVQETLWVAARSLHTFRRVSALATWLFTIVRNKCLRLLRRRQAEPDLADLLPQAPPTGTTTTDAESEAITRQTERLLASALGKCDPTYREAILLRDVEGFSAPEAAEQLGISVPALKSRLHRARNQLREQLLALGFRR